jgi:NAD(P)-dependent dehydrogenase (short-subunit alcohol dehydrogenase family)
MNTDIFNELVDLQGQVALVTEGGRGLGRAFAQAFAFAGDVTQQQTVDHVVTTVVQRLGAVDILVNNAGVITPIGPVSEIDAAKWWQTIEINLHGSFLYTHAILPHMIKRGRGRIINISSGAAYHAVPYASAYGLSKAAISYLSSCLAAEIQPYGIQVFAYASGFVRMAMTEYLGSAPEVHQWFGDGFRSRLETGNDTPFEQAVQVFLWLVSGRADKLSGCDIEVSDNIADLMERVEDIQRRKLYTLQRITKPS